MTSYRVRYEGPPALAVRAATMVAEADGVELTSSHPPERRAGEADTVILALTVDATSRAVMDAVEQARDRLPAGVRLTVEDQSI